MTFGSVRNAVVKTKCIANTYFLRYGGFKLCLYPLTLGNLGGSVGIWGFREGRIFIMKPSMICCSNEVEKSTQGQRKQSTRNINSGGGQATTGLGGKQCCQ